MQNLVFIREVADHFGIPISTLHYWERRGLVVPERRAGWRYYDEAQVYRISLIHLWRQTGRMSIEEIADLLEVSESWEAILKKKIEDLDEQLALLTSARDYLAHLSTCPHGPRLEACPDFRAQVDVPASLAPASPRPDALRQRGIDRSGRRVDR